MSEHEPAMYGQCPKCGGNLAECFSRGCPRDPPKPPSPEELSEFQTKVRAAYAAQKAKAMTQSQSTDDLVAWHESGPLWDAFVRWSADACSPGAGHGHLVEWYWHIFKRGAETNADLAARDKTIETMKEDAERWRYVFPLFWFRMAVITHFGKIGDEVVDINAAIDAARSEVKP